MTPALEKLALLCGPVGAFPFLVPERWVITGTRIVGLFMRVFGRFVISSAQKGYGGRAPEKVVCLCGVRGVLPFLVPEKRVGVDEQLLHSSD